MTKRSKRTYRVVLLSFVIVSTLAMILTALAVPVSVIIGKNSLINIGSFNVPAGHGIVCNITYNKNMVPLRVDFWDPDGYKTSIPLYIGPAVKYAEDYAGWWSVDIVNEDYHTPTTVTYDAYVL